MDARFPENQPPNYAIALYQAKMQARTARLARRTQFILIRNHRHPPADGLRLVPNHSHRRHRHGFQDYHQVAGRATAVAIDPADLTGNTIYIGGAQGGVWKSTNAAPSIATMSTGRR